MRLKKAATDYMQYRLYEVELRDKTVQTSTAVTPVVVRPLLLSP